jgi:hypothetical protein
MTILFNANAYVWLLSLSLSLSLKRYWYFIVYMYFVFISIKSYYFPEISDDHFNLWLLSNWDPYILIRYIMLFSLKFLYNEKNTLVHPNLHLFNFPPNFKKLYLTPSNYHADNFTCGTCNTFFFYWIWRKILT